MADLEDRYEDNADTRNIHIRVRNESVELSRAFFRQLVERSSPSLVSHLVVSTSTKQYYATLDVDPRIFHAYLLYLQSDCLIRPESLSAIDFINGLRTCGAPVGLLTDCERFDSTSILFSHEQYCHLASRTKRTRWKWFNGLILLGFLIASCTLTIDLYRQMFILTGNSHQKIPQIFIILVYIIDSTLLIYTSVQCILRIIYLTDGWKELRMYPKFFVDIISCLGILLYFSIQHPITSISFSRWNWIWILIHTCRTIRIVQMGFYLFDIQWCLNAIGQCSWPFLQTITGLIWFFTFSGSILYTMGLIENSAQFSNAHRAILSAHETLYALGYRNNAPHGIGTRLWTITSIYLMTPLVQMLLWWFQSKIALQWSRILKKTIRISKQYMN